MHAFWASMGTINSLAGFLLVLLTSRHGFCGSLARKELPPTSD